MKYILNFMSTFDEHVLSKLGVKLHLVNPSKYMTFKMFSQHP